jgi:hypothetical protein
MRYRLRTLLLALLITPPILASIVNYVVASLETTGDLDDYRLPQPGMIEVYRPVSQE